MELKLQSALYSFIFPNTFNRTAYGIEIRMGHPNIEGSITFNRTAYGIEMLFSEKDGNMVLTFNRTAYGIEMGIIRQGLR